MSRITHSSAKRPSEHFESQAAAPTTSRGVQRAAKRAKIDSPQAPRSRRTNNAFCAFFDRPRMYPEACAMYFSCAAALKDAGVPVDRRHIALAYPVLWTLVREDADDEDAGLALRRFSEEYPSVFSGLEAAARGAFSGGRPPPCEPFVPNAVRGGWEPVSVTVIPVAALATLLAAEGMEIGPLYRLRGYMRTRLPAAHCAAGFGPRVSSLEVAFSMDKATRAFGTTLGFDRSSYAVLESGRETFLLCETELLDALRIVLAGEAESSKARLTYPLLVRNAFMTKAKKRLPDTPPPRHSARKLGTYSLMRRVAYLVGGAALRDGVVDPDHDLFLAYKYLPDLLSGWGAASSLKKDFVRCYEGGGGHLGVLSFLAAFACPERVPWIDPSRVAFLRWLFEESGERSASAKALFPEVWCLSKVLYGRCRGEGASVELPAGVRLYDANGDECSHVPPQIMLYSMCCSGFLEPEESVFLVTGIAPCAGEWTQDSAPRVAGYNAVMESLEARSCVGEGGDPPSCSRAVTDAALALFAPLRGGGEVEGLEEEVAAFAEAYEQTVGYTMDPSVRDGEVPVYPVSECLRVLEWCSLYSAQQGCGQAVPDDPGRKRRAQVGRGDACLQACPPLEDVLSLVRAGEALVAEMGQTRGPASAPLYFELCFYLCPLKSRSVRRDRTPEGPWEPTLDPSDPFIAASAFHYG